MHNKAKKKLLLFLHNFITGCPDKSKNDCISWNSGIGQMAQDILKCSIENFISLSVFFKETEKSELHRSHKYVKHFNSVFFK